MALPIGTVIDDKYRIVRVIGAGGMGTVYEGENTRIHRKVAIKTLLGAQDQEVMTRFEHEAQAAGHIGNEHILEVLDLGALPTGEQYMVMEYLEGQTLAERLRERGPMKADELSAIVHQVLVALRAAHAAGIIHRDLKPHNVFIVNQKHDRRDFVKLIDFGISKFDAGGAGLKLTTIGALLGTPSYVSPEVARGGPADARSDVYGVGVIMYQALSGKLPFNAQNLNDLLFKIARDAPDPIESHVADLDADFAALVTQAMAKAPEDRFPSAEALLDALDGWMGTRGLTPRRIAASRTAKLGSPSSAKVVPGPASATPPVSAALPPLPPPGAATVRIPGAPPPPPDPETLRLGAAPVAAAADRRVPRVVVVVVLLLTVGVIGVAGTIAWRVSRPAPPLATSAEARPVVPSAAPPPASAAATIDDTIPPLPESVVDAGAPAAPATAIARPPVRPKPKPTTSAAPTARPAKPDDEIPTMR